MQQYIELIAILSYMYCTQMCPYPLLLWVIHNIVLVCVLGYIHIRTKNNENTNANYANYDTSRVRKQNQHYRFYKTYTSRKMKKIGKPKPLTKFY